MSDAAGNIRLVNVETGITEHAFSIPGWPITTEFDPTSNKLLIVSRLDNSAETRLDVWDVNTGQPLPPTYHASSIRKVRLLDDAILAEGRPSKKLRRWELDEPVRTNTGIRDVEDLTNDVGAQIGWSFDTASSTSHKEQQSMLKSSRNQAEGTRQIKEVPPLSSDAGRREARLFCPCIPQQPYTNFQRTQASCVWQLRIPNQWRPRFSRQAPGR